MSGLARLAARRRLPRERHRPRASRRPSTALRAAGIDARAGHDAGAVPADAAALVVSTAIAADNPELAEARRRGLPVLHRSELLAELMAGRRGLAVAGAHGKSTTSAMLVAALGDASAAVGATIAGGEGTGAVWGGGPWFVAEADESDRSLLNLAPEGAILLNVDHDHHATFASLDEVREVFRAFAARLPPDGVLVVGPDAEARACADGRPLPGAGRGRRAGGVGPGRARGRPGRVRPGPGRRAPHRRAAVRRRRPQRRQRRLRAGAGRLVRRPPPGRGRAPAPVRRRGPADGGARGRRGRGGGRRLRPPPGRDPGHAGGGPRARPGARGGGVPAPPALAHAGPRAGARGGPGGRGRGRGDRRLPRPGARRTRSRPGATSPTGCPARRGRSTRRRWPTRARRPSPRCGRATSSSRWGRATSPCWGRSWWPAWKNSPSMGTPTTAPAPPELERDAPLAPLTTIRVGGTADRLCRAGSFRAASAALAWARDEGVPVAVVGRGSNLLVSDAGFRGPRAAARGPPHGHLGARHGRLVRRAAPRSRGPCSARRRPASRASSGARASPARSAARWR